MALPVPFHGECVMTVKRRFIDIDEGQLMVRAAGPEASGTPLIMLSVAPGTSLGLVPLMEHLATNRPVYAIDLPGTGESVAPSHSGDEEPPLPVFADMLLRGATALGLDQFDLYGNRVGAHTAMEMALAAPSRVGKLIVDGLFIFPWPTDKVPWTQPYEQPSLESLRNNYTPKIEIDAIGSQFTHAWQFMRDTSLYWPWFVRDGAHARSVSLPTAEALHDKTVEVLRATYTQHLVVRASFDQDWRAQCGAIGKLAMPVMADKNTVPFIPRAALKSSGRYDAWYTTGDKLKALGDELDGFLAG
jgi:pimeloyl-ACP methyl ester carboxylesterase